MRRREEGGLWSDGAAGRRDGPGACGPLESDQFQTQLKSHRHSPLSDYSLTEPGLAGS